MKPVKKDRSFLKEYGPNIVWLDDIHEIISLFETVDISTDEYQFASLEDAKEYFSPLPIHSFKISSSKPSASVEFGAMFCRIYVGGSLTSLQVYHELDDIMRRCQRKPTIFFRYPFVFLGSQIPWVTSYFWEPKVGNFPIMIVLQSLLLAWMVWVIFIQLRRYSVVRLQRRHDAPSFLRRNKDSLALALISALIGGIVTFGLTKIKDWEYPILPTMAAPETKP